MRQLRWQLGLKKAAEGKGRMFSTEQYIVRLSSYSLWHLLDGNGDNNT